MLKSIAAISGGPDSMYMLHKYKKNICVVCHVNYHKRKTSNFDEDIVRNYCKDNKIIFEKLDVSKKMYTWYAKLTNNQQSIFRQIRYDFFCKIAKKYNSKTILVAHTLDDFIETAYMQQEKKSKALFYGILKKSVFGKLHIYRPLIEISKKLIIEYCHKHNIKYAIDQTNSLDMYHRNVVRKIISSWSNSQRTAYIKKIKDYNTKNKKKAILCELMYKSWQKKNFDLDQFKKIDKSLQYHILYPFLSHNINNGKINSNKILMLQKFINTTNNHHKQLRIQNNYFAKKVVINGKQKLVLKV